MVAGRINPSEFGRSKIVKRIGEIYEAALYIGGVGCQSSVHVWVDPSGTWSPLRRTPLKSYQIFEGNEDDARDRFRKLSTSDDCRRSIAFGDATPNPLW